MYIKYNILAKILTGYEYVKTRTRNLNYNIGINIFLISFVFLLILCIFSMFYFWVLRTPWFEYLLVFDIVPIVIVTPLEYDDLLNMRISI